ncbi:hypothetical protein SynA1825c_00529 [Synechococcus sp. A18-25c]|uniref:hypothetical protein n=1 Tax=Synechococcus sp. A18-25c TaxID=1866938 RepID=UPI000C4F8627|nr:hypothetical protein [Synechococcus sp. A18-25c]MAN18433.1 hypothetical protein [Synechococcus sp. EAC657]MEC7247978.1 hypothetical protein [Cyanobacteriota bacterium]QNJ18856.1 hypothetical protein SynA1825c_00529 [Synechococcus sp. A18-25c]|tara:strand:+ start:1267 stop:1737 length:471 start_codon:yes stop_codon:yes gene_type:complete
MAAADSSSAMVQQLSRQLHAVSGIAESLTLRLLALEERFAQIETSLDAAPEHAEHDADSQQLLVESSDRLKHLQGLLEDMPAEVVTALQAVDEPAVLAVVQNNDSVENDLMESEDELDADLTETVYVDDPQISHLDEQQEVVSQESHEDQIDLLSA